MQIFQNFVGAILGNFGGNAKGGYGSVESTNGNQRTLQDFSRSLICDVLYVGMQGATAMIVHSGSSSVGSST